MIEEELRLEKVFGITADLNFALTEIKYFIGSSPPKSKRETLNDIAYVENVCGQLLLNVDKIYIVDTIMIVEDLENLLNGDSWKREEFTKLLRKIGYKTKDYKLNIFEYSYGII